MRSPREGDKDKKEKNPKTESWRLSKVDRSRDGRTEKEHLVKLEKSHGSVVHWRPSEESVLRRKLQAIVSKVPNRPNKMKTRN